SGHGVTPNVVGFLSLAGSSQTGNLRKPQHSFVVVIYGYVSAQFLTQIAWERFVYPVDLPFIPPLASKRSRPDAVSVGIFFRLVAWHEHLRARHFWMPAHRIRAGRVWNRPGVFLRLSHVRKLVEEIPLAPSEVLPEVFGFLIWIRIPS